MIDLLQQWAIRQPDHVAVRMDDGGPPLSYAELDRQANQVAQFLLSLGLAAGSVIALLTENDQNILVLWWAARRAGLYYVPVNTHLNKAELEYILENSGAQILLASAGLADLAASVQGSCAGGCYLIGTAPPGLQSFEDSIAKFKSYADLPAQAVGREFVYSSGTTGRPKGIRRPLTPFEKRFDQPLLETRLREVFQFGPGLVYLSVAPLYHATGKFLMRVLEAGGTCVIARRFDPESTLAAIETWRITHAQFVPTMFVRMLALPETVRAKYDLSGVKVALHAAAPCPVRVKRAMMDWWGPIIDEYYGGSENAGVTFISASEWLARPGSVGRPVSGTIHILGDDGAELPAGEIGGIYFGGAALFSYHGDAEKTRSAITADGLVTYGDFGHVDADGYLYISDRRNDLIISGGVNIYPKEIETVLEDHPLVAEAAVIGIPHDEFGQQVIALIRLNPDAPASEMTKRDLADHCSRNLAKFKCPRAFGFRADFPRNENGKLLKRVLREQYMNHGL